MRDAQWRDCRVETRAEVIASQMGQSGNDTVTKSLKGLGNTYKTRGAFCMTEDGLRGTEYEWGFR